MIDSLSNLGNIDKLARTATQATGAGGAPKTGPSQFDEVLSKSLDEVNQLQQDANRAVEDVAAGKSDDIAGVMSAVEKADLAFKTLLAIRAKLMDAYEEIKNMQV